MVAAKLAEQALQLQQLRTHIKELRAAIDAAKLALSGGLPQPTDGSSGASGPRHLTPPCPFQAPRSHGRGARGRRGALPTSAAAGWQVGSGTAPTGGQDGGGQGSTGGLWG
mmetsp:Transcript_18277/g.52114  ORF Transcript_18277/g.52114 Transcript_18277/m.52114 type:complete len:111 (-) Transcript_18277:191-523(-)